MLKKLIFSFAFFCFSFSVFAQRVISPVAGNFCNKQPLVIDVSDGAECFYSLSGTDPLASGFAYDGPVLIDITGRVDVKIAVIKENSKEEIEISYNVKEENPFETDSPEFNFINDYPFKTLCFYDFDDSIKIPENFTYCFGDGEKAVQNGRELLLDPANCLSRYVACRVFYGKNEWRFIVFVNGEQVGTLSRYSVPFEINNWNEFCFTGEKLIWQLDDNDWSASKIPLRLDRSVKHTVRWQSVAYESGNPVQSFVIPAEPVLNVSVSEKKAVTFNIEGDLRYRMKIVSSGVNGIAQTAGGLFTSATFDTFEGDEIKGTAVFAFYADGVFQGTKSADFCVDKQPPLAPVFVTENSSNYLRGRAELAITAEDGADIFYAVSKPVKIQNVSAGLALSALSDSFNSVEAGNFKPYTAPFELLSQSGSPVFYKVRAWASDKNGNSSIVSEYRVIIDEDNYYLDSSAAVTANADGTANNPFTSVDQAIEVINSRKFTRFFVNGSFTFSEGETVISSNCAFTAQGNAEFVLLDNAGLVVKNSSFEANGIVFKKNRGSELLENSKFFTVENSTLSFDGCEIVGIFGENGIGFDCRNSVIEFKNSGVTVQSDSYVCAVSAVDSKVFAKNCRFASVAPTCVDFSVNGGQFELRNSVCKVSAHLGRIAELCGTNARLTGNFYSGEFDKKLRGVLPVWSDKDTMILEDENNNSTNF